MSVTGHFSWALIIYMLIPPPFNWIVLLFSHFVLDLYPDYWTTNILKYWKSNLLYGIGQVIMLMILISLAIHTIGLSWVTLMWIFILAMYPDITEAIYMGIAKIAERCNKGVSRKFWFCHLGWFPFKVNTWQYSAPGFPCFNVKDTLLFDFVFVILAVIFAEVGGL